MFHSYTLWKYFLGKKKIGNWTKMVQLLWKEASVVLNHDWKSMGNISGMLKGHTLNAKNVTRGKCCAYRKSHKILRDFRDIFFARLLTFHLWATFIMRNLDYIFFLLDFFQPETLKTIKTLERYCIFIVLYFYLLSDKNVK